MSPKSVSKSGDHSNRSEESSYDRTVRNVWSRVVIRRQSAQYKARKGCQGQVHELLQSRARPCVPEPGVRGDADTGVSPEDGPQPRDICGPAGRSGVPRGAMISAADGIAWTRLRAKTQNPPTLRVKTDDWYVPGLPPIGPEMMHPSGNLPAQTTKSEARSAFGMAQAKTRPGNFLKTGCLLEYGHRMGNWWKCG